LSPLSKARRQELAGALALVLVLGHARAWGGPTTPKVSAAPGEVTVAVRPLATVSVPQVAIKDVAVCEGGNAALRTKISRLDLADLPPEGETISITQEQIYFRICLSGIDPKLFRIRGASLVAVSFPRYLVTEDDVVSAAKKAVVDRLPDGAEEVSVKLAQPVRGLMVLPCTRDDVGFEPEINATVMPLGKVHVDIAVLVNGERRGSVAVQLDVKAYHQVAVCKQRVESGEVLAKDKVHFERRPLDGSKEYLTLTQGLAGKRSKHTLMPGQSIAMADVEAFVSETAIVVKQQGLVKLVARLGSFQLVAIGEALQDGRAGQLIRVRNIDSRNIVVGRVVDRSIVEVDY
jgi:flagella basal body P-ring formation protein FlgA